MKKNIQVAVPKPCQENFSSFAKTSNGGFCSSCQKEVIDFTTWSEDRLKAYFKNSRGNTCGRFRQEQLKVYTYDNTSRTGWGWLSFTFAGMLLLFSSRQAAAQHTPKQTIEQYQPDPGDETSKPRQAHGGNDRLVVSGVVKSVEDKTTMPGVNVVLKGTTTGTATDADGRFMLTLSNPGSSPVLVFSFIGLKTAEYAVDIEKPNEEMIVDMVYDNVGLSGEFILGGAMDCRWYSPRRLWWRIKSLF